MLPFLHIAAADAGVKVENVFVAIGASRPEINVDNIPDDAIIIGTHQFPTSQVAAFISFLLRPAIKFSPTILSHVGAMISMQCAIAASCVPSHVSFFLARFIVSKCRSRPFRCHLRQCLCSDGHAGNSDNRRHHLFGDYRKNRRLMLLWALHLTPPA